MSTPTDAARTGLTYGTFDLFHIGHLRILQRTRELCDRLVVGISTDEFNAVKGKRTAVPFADRTEIVSALRFVDDVFPEESWEQKPDDITRYGVDLLVMGDDWQGEFDYLKELCEVSYLARTPGVSTTALRGHVAELARVSGPAAPGEYTRSTHADLDH
jgi:glycerol-3-phosphate cytidylyltransferase